MESLSALTMDDGPISPAFISPKMPFDQVFIADIDPCQQDLTWDHLPDDIWTDDMVDWLYVVDTTTETSPSTSSSSKEWQRKFPSDPIPALDTNIQWQHVKEEYSPSVYSQDSNPLGKAAQQLIEEMPLSPTRYISMDDILTLAANTQSVCAELRATINRAEDSAEFDESDSDSDVSMIDLNVTAYNSDVSIFDLEPLPIPSITFHSLANDRGLRITCDDSASDSDVSELNLQRFSTSSILFYSLARDRGLEISSDRSASSSRSGSRNHNSIDCQQRSNAPSPSQCSRQNSVKSYVRVGIQPLPQIRHHISPDILNRMARLANSGLTIQIPRSSVYECALPTDGNGFIGGK